MLKEFQEIEYLNYGMAEYKKLANLSFGGNIKAAFKPAVASIKAGKKDIMGVAKKLLPMSMAEKWIKQNPNGTAAEFKKLPPFMFNEIKNNNIIANAFLDSTKTDDPSLDDLIASGSVSFKTGMADYEFTSVKQLQLDLEDANKGSSDDGTKKALKKARANLGLLERNFLIISNLKQNNINAEPAP